MCGIVGYVGHRPAQEVLLSGLEKLEYRGYDSAGISVQSDGHMESVRAVGNLARLKAAVGGTGARRRRRGARAGPQRGHRSHALGDARARHRGERAPALRRRGSRPRRGQRHRRELPRAQRRADHRRRPFQLGDRRRGDRAPDRARIDEHGFVEAVRRAYNRLRGHYSFVAVCGDEPGVLVGARKECPLIVGCGDGEYFLASGIPAFLAHTRTVQALDDDELVVLRPGAPSS